MGSLKAPLLYMYLLYRVIGLIRDIILKIIKVFINIFFFYIKLLRNHYFLLILVTTYIFNSLFQKKIFLSTSIQKLNFGQVAYDEISQTIYHHWKVSSVNPACLLNVINSINRHHNRADSIYDIALGQVMTLKIIRHGSPVQNLRRVGYIVDYCAPYSDT
jgi:hypothetical protein